MKVWILNSSQAWDRFIQKFFDLPRNKENYVVLVEGAGVTRCTRCEPDLFRYFHQFVLDGGRAVICVQSLAQYGIPETRPPDFFERIKNTQAFLKELKAQGYEVEYI